jgi:hypothetical protein
MNELALEEATEHRERLLDLLERFEVVELNRTVLNRAAQPMPVPLGTLDAIHLATALLWTEHRTEELVMATHDSALGLAARAEGLSVIGC